MELNINILINIMRDKLWLKVINRELLEKV